MCSLQLEQNLLERVNALVQSPDSDFWRSGRFIVHAGSQLASHNDGEYTIQIIYQKMLYHLDEHRREKWFNFDGS
jgi:hypothetical protein